MNAWTWLLQRVSAVLLLCLIAIHLWRLHVAKIVVLDVVESRFDLWSIILLDLSLLTVGMFHGLNGLYAVLADFGLQGKAATVTVISLCTVFAGFLAVGTYALFQFIA